MELRIEKQEWRQSRAQRLGVDLEWRTCNDPCSLGRIVVKGVWNGPLETTRLAQSETLSKTCRWTSAVTVRSFSDGTAGTLFVWLLGKV